MKWKKLASIGCLLMVMALLLSACQSESEPGGIDSGSEEITTEIVDPYDDGLPDLDFQDAEIRIACRGTGLWQSELSANPEEGRIEKVVYERNAAVEERLNVALTILPGDSDPTVYMRTLYNTIFMAQENYCEIIAGVQYEAAVYLNRGLFQNIGKTQYLDFSQPWWNSEYMSEIGIGSDYVYLAAGDISLTMTAWSSCVFVNAELYTDLYPDKGSLGIYQMVEDNQWTYETLRRMCEEVYVDRDNVEGVSYGDVLGFAVNKGTPMDHFSLTANLNFSDRDQDGYPIICINNEHTLNFESSLKTLLKETDGVLLYDYHNTAGYAGENFFNGEALFAVDMLGSAITQFSEMEDNYAIIPMPKLNAEQDEYYSSTIMVDNQVLLENIAFDNAKFTDVNRFIYTFESSVEESAKVYVDNFRMYAGDKLVPMEPQQEETSTAFVEETTDPETITIPSDQESDTTAPNEGTTSDNGDDGENSGCSSAIAGGLAIILCTTAVSCVCCKKKKD